ncbi:immunity 7 family protein [Hymenobacter sp. J193]|uniref:immunity 7 family protein n=1 Tax=Hymenobacter sp. J193 TaxID=2898429 RepID=UPI00215181D1|nr:immunity 7 family protein [Hymenobacter sp. J193]MCR5886526.1 immunity 7 family protein [Hymenobacter sp. J193]
MIEIHGWITLRYSDYHSEIDLQNAAVERFRQYMQQEYSWVLLQNYGRITTWNGLESFSIHVLHNHKQEFYALKIFNWVAQELPGSYGLLYFHDEEDENRFNEFQVYVLKRGKLVEAQDQLLSPYWEAVEKDYDEDNPPRD